MDEEKMLQIAESSTVVCDAFENPLIRESIAEFRRFRADPEFQVAKLQHRLLLFDIQSRENAKKTEGIIEGRIAGIVDILSHKFGQVPQHIVDSLHQQTNLATLNSLLLQATKCTSLDEFVAGF
ncbi:MAG: hypothetical protein LBQ66_09855 [Planctomycetaceae bacterium]|nr:hypothetical protein [Planctomycetaceae bacterium]